MGSTPISPAKENISMKEIELLQFPWKTFTLVEVIANALSNLKEKVLCSLAGKHSWKILISNWQISRVNSVNSFRNRNASNLKCKHCNITKHFTDAELNHTENLYYNWYTDIEFSYNFHQD